MGCVTSMHAWLGTVERNKRQHCLVSLRAPHLDQAQADHLSKRTKEQELPVCSHRGRAQRVQPPAICVLAPVAAHERNHVDRMHHGQTCENPNGVHHKKQR